MFSQKYKPIYNGELSKTVFSGLVTPTSSPALHDTLSESGQ